jgi:hypothetical protein
MRRGIASAATARNRQRNRQGLDPGVLRVQPREGESPTLRRISGALVGLGISLVLASIISKINADYYQDMSLYGKILAPGMLTGLIVGDSMVRYGVPARGSSVGRNA